MRKRALFVLFVATLVVSIGATAMAEGQAESTYPEKSAEFMIPFGAGGSADTLGRAIVSAAEPFFGESFVPVNRPGGGGAVMYQAMYNEPSDGYTIGWSSTSILTATNIGNVPFAYDAFDHVARVGYTSLPIAVRADAPWDTVEEFVAAAKADPGGLAIGNAGTGSATHLTAVVFATKSGIDVIHVPNGAERRIPALLGGETQAVCVPLPEIGPFVESGDAKILAFPTVNREPAYPDVPTMREAGYDVVIELFRSISVPKGTDPEILDYLEEVFRQAVQEEEFLDVSARYGFVIDYMGREDFADYLAAQDVLIAEAMDAGGLR